MTIVELIDSTVYCALTSYEARESLLQTGAQIKASCLHQAIMPDRGLEPSAPGQLARFTSSSPSYPGHCAVGCPDGTFISLWKDPSRPELAGEVAAPWPASYAKASTQRHFTIRAAPPPPPSVISRPPPTAPPEGDGVAQSVEMGARLACGALMATTPLRVTVDD